MIEVTVLHAPDFKDSERMPNKTFLNPQYIVQVIPMAGLKNGEIKHKTDESIFFRSTIQMMDGTLFFCTHRAETIVEAMRR